MTHCEHCLTWAGRLNTRNRCCFVRHVAGMPKQRRMAVYEKVKAEEGQGALERIKADVLAEYHRAVAAEQIKAPKK